jgi:hypothetical protein
MNASPSERGDTVSGSRERGGPAAAAAAMRGGRDGRRAGGAGDADSMFAPGGPFTALATLCLFVGLTAITGGLTLVARPDGSLVQMSVETLRHSPFRDFLIPGLVLALVVGVPNLLAGVIALQRRRATALLGLFAGAMITGWIVVEYLLLHAFHWLQALYLIVGLATLVTAWVLVRTGAGDRDGATSDTSAARRR